MTRGGGGLCRGGRDWHRGGFCWPFDFLGLLNQFVASFEDCILAASLSLSALVPVQSLSFSVNVIGSFGMMKGRLASEAGQWS